PRGMGVSAFRANRKSEYGIEYSVGRFFLHAGHADGEGAQLHRSRGEVECPSDGGDGIDGGALVARAGGHWKDIAAGKRRRVSERWDCEGCAGFAFGRVQRNVRLSAS